MTYDRNNLKLHHQIAFLDCEVMSNIARASLGFLAYPQA